MIVYLPCKLGENFIERKFVTWENDKRIYKDGENFGLYGFDKGLYSSSIRAIPLSSYQKCLYGNIHFLSYDASGRFSQEYLPKYKISVDLDTVYKLSDIGFPSGKKAHLYGLFKKDNSLYAEFVTTDRYEHLRYRIKDTIQYAGLDEEPLQTQIIYEPEEREDLEMARDFKGARSSSLKDIANKMKVVSTVIMNMDDLIENPDNEYLFGMDGLDRLEESIKVNGFKGSVQAWKLPDGKAELFDGHKRRRAKLNAGDKDIPVTLYDMPETEAEKRIALLYFNLGVRNAVVNDNPIYTARQIAYHRETMKMMNFKGEKRKELSKVFGISESQITKYEAILKLNDNLQELAGQNRLGLDNVSAIGNLDEEKQQIVFECIVEERKATGECSSDKINTFIKAVKAPEELPEVIVNEENGSEASTQAVSLPVKDEKPISDNEVAEEGITEDNNKNAQTDKEDEKNPAEQLEEKKNNAEKLREKIKTTDNYKMFRKSCDNFQSTISNIDDYGDNIEEVITRLKNMLGMIDNEIQRLTYELEESNS